MNIRIKSVAFFAIVSMLMASCSQQEQEKSVDHGEKRKPTKIETVGLQLDNPTYHLSVPGELQAYESVEVYAKVDGFVKKIYVDRGSEVRKGQVLAILEAPEMEQRYLQDQASRDKMFADYSIAKREFERIKDASLTEGAVSLLELEKANSNMQSAKAAYEATKATAGQSQALNKYLVIVAPFDGVITSRHSSVGALVGPRSATPIFNISQKDRLRLMVSLPEKHSASIANGMDATFTVTSYPDKVFSAKLMRNSGLLENTDRSLILEFDIDNSKLGLKGREYAQVDLTLKRNAPSYWISSSNILSSQEGKFLITPSNGQLTKLPISEGIRLDTLVEVFGELSGIKMIIKNPTEEMVGTNFNKNKK